MSAAFHSVRTIRNAALESGLSMREQSPSERDEMRRSETASESIESLIAPLTARQMHAINLLAMGKTVVATARSLDIGVSTLHRWKATHPLFKAELARRQHNLFDAMIQKLRLTMRKAVDNLFEMMNSAMKSERKEVTHAMLKLLRPQKFLVPSEPMSAEAVLDEAVREKRASRGESMSEEITEEERIAAIPEEFRVREEVKHQGHQGHEEDGKREVNAGFVARGDVAESRSRAGKRHVERSETSCPSERVQTSKREVTNAHRKTTPLPSREGPGEGAAADEVGEESEGTTAKEVIRRRIANRDHSADAAGAMIANAHHTQSKSESVIASRPLPQPATEASPIALPQGEGSEQGSLANRSATAMSESATVKPGQILREYAQDDGVYEDGRAAEERCVAKNRHAERSEASGPSEREETTRRAVTNAHRKTTPLPSREGLGEGAAADEIGEESEGTTAKEAIRPQRGNRAKPADETSAEIADASHVQPNLETAIAPRPLPPHLPQGEGSEDGSLADGPVAASDAAIAHAPHAQANLETVIAPRPLPQPATEASPIALPQGEGSQKARAHNQHWDAE